jgi:hypoxanthine-DNA glycosylase
VVGEATRTGSLDGAIRGATPNELRNFAATHPGLRAIAFNGKTAARLGRAVLADVMGVELIDLPSSSPAYTLPFDEKASAWALLGQLTG